MLAYRDRLLWLLPSVFLSLSPIASAGDIGREVSVKRHLQDGEEFKLPLRKLILHGRDLFTASWTIEEGGGRPLTKANGSHVSDPNETLVFPRNFNRVSSPDANSCAGCHNSPFGIPGGGGDIVGNVFVEGGRFDFATFDHNDLIRTKGAVDEENKFVTPYTIANSRGTPGMFGSGFIEMLARQMTADLKRIRNAIPPGGSSALVSKGVSFGILKRLENGDWDTSEVEGIPPQSLMTSGANNPPSLVIRPFHQAGNTVSIRHFTNGSFNFHHGIQSTETFGLDTDPDGDGVVNEITRADMTAIVIFQATMAVPGRVIPNDPEIERAVILGEERFDDIGCTRCHIPSLPLNRKGWIFSEPNPFNPRGSLQRGQAPTFAVDLTSKKLPAPRLKVENRVVHVPAYTDLKLHNITSGPNDPNVEALDMNQKPGSGAFFGGNAFFLTRKLWGAANEPPYFHHGQFTTLREAVLAHAGEAEESSQAFRSLSPEEQDSVIEFLKTLQVLPPRTKHLIVDENGKRKKWPPTRR